MLEIINTIKNNDVVLDAALMFHNYSIKKYRVMAEDTSEGEIKNLFQAMSLEDNEFASVIKKLIENKSGSIEESSNLVGEYGTYIDLILTRVIPEKIKQTGLNGSEAVRTAIAFEEKKSEFYDKTLKFFTFADQEHINSLCGKIILRINRLKELLNSLEG